MSVFNLDKLEKETEDTAIEVWNKFIQPYDTYDSRMRVIEHLHSLTQQAYEKEFGKRETLPPKDPEERMFWDMYKRLAEDGECDGVGGLEYQRVLAEWIEAGRPKAVKRFIRKQV